MTGTATRIDNAEDRAVNSSVHEGLDATDVAPSTLGDWNRDESPGTARSGEPVSPPADRYRSFLHQLHRLMLAGERPLDAGITLELLESALDALLAVTGAEDASVLTVDEENRDLVFVVTRGKLAPETLAWSRIPAGLGIAQWVVKARRAAIINDIGSDPRYYPRLDYGKGYSTRNLVSAPLESEGRVLGVVEALNKADGALFTIEDLSNIRMLAGQISTLLARLEVEMTAPHRAIARGGEATTAASGHDERESA